MIDVVKKNKKISIILLALFILIVCIIGIIIYNNNTYELVINKGGEYVIDKNIKKGVYIDTNEDVKLILNGVNITNNKGPAIINNKNNSLEIEINGTNQVSDTEKYKLEDNSIDGCIFSYGDIIISGEGSITVTSNYKHSIVSRNNIIVNSGNINIDSNDKGIQSYKDITINDGNINIVYSNEGIEGGDIYINAGSINIKSTDDCLNSSLKDDDLIDEVNLEIIIKGGKLTMNTISGDGIDSNGSIYIDNGEVIIYGPGDDNRNNTFIDYDKQFIVNGGTIVAGCSHSNLVQDINDDSKQKSILLNVLANKDDKIVIKDSYNNIICEYETLKLTEHIFCSSSKIKTDEKYNVYVNDVFYDQDNTKSSVSDDEAIGAKNYDVVS